MSRCKKVKEKQPSPFLFLHRNNYFPFKFSYNEKYFDLPPFRDDRYRMQ